MINNSIITKVKIYTDGACRGNPGPGGWGAILIYGNNKKKSMVLVKILQTILWS